METDLKIEVATLDRSRRHALEAVIDCGLASNQHLNISVIEVKTPVTDDAWPHKSWMTGL